MNFLWPIIIIVSYCYAIISNNMENVNQSIFSSISDVVTLTLTLVGNMCLWCGLMNIVKHTKIIVFLKKILKPVLRFLYPEDKENEEIMEEVAINMISNMMGIGNAATPAGLKSMEKMQKHNKRKKVLTDSMSTLIVLNTTSIQLIPTTILAIRSSLNSSNPSKIIIPIWISTFTGTVIGLIVNKMILQLNKRKKSDINY